MKTRKASMKLKITLFIAIAAFVCFSILSYMAYFRAKKLMITQIQSNSMGLAKIAASYIDPDEFLAIEEQDDAHYTAVLNVLTNFLNSDEIVYIYTMKKDENNNIVFVVDSDPDDPADYLEEYDEDLSGADPAFHGTAVADTEATEDEWGKIFSAYAPIMKDDTVIGIVGCDVAYEEVQSRLNQVRMEFLAISILFDIVAIFAALYVAGSVSKNLKKLYNKVKAINSGDGDLTKRIMVHSGDELEVVADEFNNFIENVRILVAGIAETSETVSVNSDDMNSSTEECKENIASISAALQNLNASMEESGAGVLMMLENMEKQTEIITETCKSTDESAKEASGISEDALSKQQRMMQQALAAEKLVGELTETLAETAKRCEKIHEIEDLAGRILKVSGTTQILSLNANIEAARSGEAGRGFAVIAGNIEELSKQISSLAGQINETNATVIASVEEMIEKVHVAMDFIATNVLTDYKDFEQIGADYSGNMQHMSDVLNGINARLDGVQESVMTLQCSVKEMGEVINESTLRIGDVAENSSGLLTGMETLAEKAEQNNEEMAEMQKQISRFKY